MSYKTNITDCAQLQSVIDPTKHFFAIDLIHCPSLASRNSDDLITEIYKFCRPTSTFEGHIKTRRDRFPTLDQLIRTLLSDLQAEVGSGPIKVHDAAASTAVTSADLFRTLSADIDVEMVSSDISTSMTIDRFDNGWRLISIADAGWMQAIHSRTNKIVFRHPNRKFTPSLQQYLEQCTQTAAIRSTRNIRFVWTLSSSIEYSMWHPRAKALAASDPRFRLMRHDILEPAGESFHLVRAMNVLSQLPKPARRLALQNMAASLFEGGFLVAGRGETEASVFRKVRGAFVHVADLATAFRHKNAILELAF